MEKKIMVGDKECTMRASALLPRMYRYHFGHDLVRDMTELQKNWSKVLKDLNNPTEEEKKQAQFSAMDLMVFENIAWLMLKHGGEDVGDNPDEWLDSLDGIFSVYEILPIVLELWQGNQKTTSVLKKK